MTKIITIITAIFFCMAVFADSVRCQKEGSRTNAADMDLQCVVRLRVTFLASGIADDITALPAETTCKEEKWIDQAVNAAKKIKFEPAKADGKPVTVVKQVEYTFSLYYEEDSPKLSQKALITKPPEPKFPSHGSLVGTVKITIVLLANSRIEIQDVETTLPQEYKDAAVTAVKKIKFYPAVRRDDGHKVSQTKTITYEVKPNKE